VGVLATAYVFVRTRPFGRVPSEQWAAITNFPDSATSPALSADGRMLAFLRGPSTFVGRGQVYVKLLPHGEPKQLTNDSYEKMSPVFSTDTSQVAYTVVDQTGNWDTWIVSVLGGDPRRFLPNASGLTWVDSERVLFSEIKKGNHMAVVTATASRAGPRDVYVPAKETGMGHRSYASPDRKWVLVVEMEQSRWLPCRLAPFDGSSKGQPVGPSGPCTSAAWSPDGKWMYFSSDAGSGFHIWRERFPEGSPEQITLGPTEEEGIAMAPDGGWFFTSAGVKQSAIWLHDARVDRQISLEGFADLPGLGVGATHSVFSPDEKRLYFVVGRNSAGPFVAGELAAADLDSGRTERLLPGILMTSFDISADNKRVVFAKPDAGGKSRIWLASLDRRFPPRQLSNAEGDQPFFSRASQIIFRGAEGAAQFVFRIREDGSEMEKMVFDVTNNIEAVSPDGSWVVASVAVPGASEEDRPTGFLAYPVSGGPPTRICAFCDVGWSGDGRFFYLRLRSAGMGEGGTAFVIALPPGKTLPPLPQGGIQSEADLARLRVVQRIELTDVPHISFAPSFSVYAFSRATVQRNLYRIPAP
jgi:Tol biopolymer transport system component